MGRPDVTIEDGHPVIFAAAGSHASYFEAGEYLTAVPLPALRPVRRGLEALRRFWRDTLRQDDPGDLGSALEAALSIPFVDYARGDGLAVGPGGQAAWTPIPVGDDTPWIDGYRGLWGLDTNDRFAGERAPAGPRYTRDGSPRQSWHDPLGFLGLDKVAPPGRLPQVLRGRIEELEDARATTADEAALRATELRRRAAAVTPRPIEEVRLTGPTADETSIERAEAELAELRARDAELADALSAAREALARAEAGDPGDPRAHLRNPRRPQPPEDRAYGRAVEIWSAVSAGLMVFAWW